MRRYYQCDLLKLFILLELPSFGEQVAQFRVVRRGNSWIFM